MSWQLQGRQRAEASHGSKYWKNFAVVQSWWLGSDFIVNKLQQARNPLAREHAIPLSLRAHLASRGSFWWRDWPNTWCKASLVLPLCHIQPTSGRRQLWRGAVGFPIKPGFSTAACGVLDIDLDSGVQWAVSCSRPPV